MAAKSPLITVCLLGLLLLWGICMALLTPQAGKLAALELANNGEQLHNLIVTGAPEGRQDAIRLNTKLDYVFILLYTLSICAMAWTVAGQRGSWDVMLFLVVLTILAAAIFDVLENAAILKVVGGNTVQFTQENAVSIHAASRIKWSCCYLAIGLLGLQYVATLRRNRLLLVTGALLIVCAVLGGIGVALTAESVGDVSGVTSGATLVADATGVLIIAIPLAMWGLWRLAKSPIQR